jgi:hypothetical protein
LESKRPGFQPDHWRPLATGQWQLTYPAGAQWITRLTVKGNNEYELRDGGILDGVYRVRGDELEVVTPADERMVGLSWAWEKDELVLVGEPSPPPAGSSYLGSRLRRRQGFTPVRGMQAEADDQ